MLRPTPLNFCFSHLNMLISPLRLKVYSIKILLQEKIKAAKKNSSRLYINFDSQTFNFIGKDYKYT
nr:MAG TPA: hypothetical protein [Caudoviricetes sp.]